MTEEFQYKAFLSYSHKDKKAGAWLHKQLEKYRLPKNLMSTLSEDGRSSGSGVGTRGIGRIFRDRDELPAAEDLTEAVRKALETSQYMVVLCSPNSAASRWVNKEIIEFKRLRGDKYVLPIILDGEPFASDSGAPERECFPPAVRFKIAKTGGLSTLPAEPAAADARKDADGKQRAVLKILAGILGVGLDQLVEREMRRRQKRVTIITAGAAAAVLVMATLTYEAMTARDAANRSRAEAEDLVEFMLTDLREKLEPVGRLDVLDAVGEKVLSYHDNQLAYEDASDDDIGRRARAYHLLAEMEWKRGNMDEAQQMFEQAAAATEELLKRDPNNTQRIFEHAQSVFWVGNQDFERGDFEAAEIAFREYETQANNLLEIEPGNIDWTIEAAYANNNLGDLYMRGFNQPRKALPYIEKALSLFRAASAVKVDSTYVRRWVAVEYYALADVNLYIGHLDNVKKYKSLEREVLDSLLTLDGNDQHSKERLIYWYTSSAWYHFLTGNFVASKNDYGVAEQLIAEQLKLDPDNSHWLESKVTNSLRQVLLSLQDNGQRFQAKRNYLKIQDLSASLLKNDAVKLSFRLTELKFFNLLVSLELKVSENGILLNDRVITDVFARMSNSTNTLRKTQKGRWVLISIFGLKIQHLILSGERQQAVALFEEMFEIVDGSNIDQAPSVLMALQKVAQKIGAKEKSEKIRQTLINRGYGQALIG